jgi:hypothetical protein
MKRACAIVFAVIGIVGAQAASDDKPKETPMTKDSAWTWGYFFAENDVAKVTGIFANRKISTTVYRVDRVVPVTGKPGVSLNPGSTLVRVESAARLFEPKDAKAPSLLFFGVPQHLEYTTGEQRADLNQRSRAELLAGADTIAVIITIRKNTAWWALPADERMAYFQKKGDKIGHTAIGAKYVERIYRKLYHTRYAVETTDHDFITYFEFERKHTDDFKSLLRRLRDSQENPEWSYVDREYEIWLTKSK